MQVESVHRADVCNGDHMQEHSALVKDSHITPSVAMEGKDVHNEAVSLSVQTRLKEWVLKADLKFSARVPKGLQPTISGARSKYCDIMVGDWIRCPEFHAKGLNCLGEEAASNVHVR
jgi:hypothetical protein